MQLVESRSLTLFVKNLFCSGNDVSSGVKWAMLSQSVVLMPPPTVTSWAMEELLEPWVVRLANEYLFRLALRIEDDDPISNLTFSPFACVTLSSQHYIPLNEEATDVEEKMKWIKSHDDEAKRISERATLWMEDLVFHPDAIEDDRRIQEEILMRYEAHFKHT